jgi:hypothetical protein
MMNSPGIPMYAHYATLINYMYAAKHGYGFMVVRCPDRRDMDKDWAYDPNNEYVFVWSKARMLSRALELFDIVVYIDSDAHVWDQSITVEQKVAELMPDPKTCFAFAADCRDTSLCWNGDDANAGVVLVRKSPKTTEILDHWMDPDRDCAEWKYKHTREQACINILRTKYYSDFIRKVPVEKMNGSDGTWIRHYMARSAEDRQVILQRELAKQFSEFVKSPECGVPTGFLAHLVAKFIPVMFGMVVGVVVYRYYLRR